MPHPPRQARRIALYSHDAMGIGHVRRNLLVATALAGAETPTASMNAPGGTSTLLISGVYEAGAFELPPGVDCLTLPSLRKDERGSYEPRRLAMITREVLSLRSAVIRSALAEFDPDVLIVDKLPRGVDRELDPSLEAIKRAGRRTRCVLGLRDILDEPSAVRGDWRREAGEEAVREYYDAVWVYGSPRVYDVVSEYDLPPDIAAKVRYSGYLARPAPPAADAGEGRDDGGGYGSGYNPLCGTDLPRGRFALCSVGGGEDGAFLAEAFARAPLPEEMSAVLLTGPFMPRDARRRLRQEARRQPRLRLLEFCTAPHDLIARADRVVAMGGYNTIAEILSYDKPALIAPRVSPRKEQLIRSERLHELGLIDLLYPEQVTPAAVGGWLARELPPRPPARERVDMGGLDRLPRLLAELSAGGADREAGRPRQKAPAAAQVLAAKGDETRVGQ
jgi:predicted glycosyltransferase